MINDVIASEYENDFNSISNIDSFSEMSDFSDFDPINSWSNMNRQIGINYSKLIRKTVNVYTGAKYFPSLFSVCFKLF